jgi:hypothetical protein
MGNQDLYDVPADLPFLRHHGNDLESRPVVVAGLPVRPAGDEGVVHVARRHDLHETGGEEDPPGVPRAVEAFVMVPGDHGGQDTGILQVIGQEEEPGQGVMFEGLALGFPEGGLLRQDLQGDADLAEIVERPRRRLLKDLLKVVEQIPCEVARQGEHQEDVVICIGIVTLVELDGLEHGKRQPGHLQKADEAAVLRLVAEDRAVVPPFRSGREGPCAPCRTP